MATVSGGRRIVEAIYRFDGLTFLEVVVDIDDKPAISLSADDER